MQFIDILCIVVNSALNSILFPKDTMSKHLVFKNWFIVYFATPAKNIKVLKGDSHNLNF